MAELVVWPSRPVPPLQDPPPKLKQGQGQPEVHIVNNLHIHNIKPNMSYTQ